ncbi:hypothetical protein K470DRAFT_76352 [Piedraia hortae CBS 480.64]|uniref:J domain-containing protein n=1 Tax=Piedraia hortae CBS 480.64 TaxID=1314780 RepID=A0A6A7C0D5_9PEZI|nr:hypothetical protein K470DRAFT_76352 [Piedraia hortae CBS 480.64]
MSAEYNYDPDAQFFPFFVLTIATIINVPLTYSLLRAPSDASATKKIAHIASNYQPENGDLVAAQRSKQKRKELRLKRMVTCLSLWMVSAWMVYLMTVTQRTQTQVWDPYSILGVSMGANEKAINSRYRRLSVTMHPDKRKPNVALNETAESINNEWVEIVKAHKALTDEDVRSNWEQYGHPDGKQSTSFGIALPKLLIAEGNGKFVLAFYGLLLGIGLPWLVGKWWYGMQKLTRERVLVASAGNMFREYNERMDEGDVLAAVSTALEYRDVLNANDGELGRLEKTVLASADGELLPSKEGKRIQDQEDVVCRKTLALLWAYLRRQDLGSRTAETEKFGIAPIALQMTESFQAFCQAYSWTKPVLATFNVAQCLVQAVPPAPEPQMPLMQLPHIRAPVARAIERQISNRDGKPVTIQQFMALAPATRERVATEAGLSSEQLSAAVRVACQIPAFKVERAFFKVQGERSIIPSSLVQFIIKGRFIPPGSTNVPAPSPSSLQEPDPPEGDIQAQKQEDEQHELPLAHAPYLARDRIPTFHVFLADKRQGKVAVPPFTFGAFNRPVFTASSSGEVEPTYEVVTLKMPFQAPPHVGEYSFKAHIVCDSYLGLDLTEDVVLNVEDASRAQVVDEDNISEPDEGKSIQKSKSP